MPFRHISVKIQLKNLKQHFDCGGAGLWAPPGYALGQKYIFIVQYLSYITAVFWK